MEQKDIDIYEILKGEEYGTELYTPKCGRVWHSGMANDKDSAKAIWTEDKDGREHFFDKNGKIDKEGEVLLFPSKEMRDWSKFFKKGDVLEYAGDNGAQGTCTFEKFKDETKAQFLGRFAKEKECICKRPMIFRTADWVKSDDPAGYIRFVEERLGGKLNRETLEIEKPAKLTFEVGKLYVFNKELREATENEVELFNKHYAIWREQPDFKVFDKVLVRNGERFKWQPAFFVRDRGEEAIYRYKVLLIEKGRVADFTSCIPFEGHENIAFTSYDIENLPF